MMEKDIVYVRRVKNYASTGEVKTTLFGTPDSEELKEIQLFIHNSPLWSAINDQVETTPEGFSGIWWSEFKKNSLIKARASHFDFTQHLEQSEVPLSIQVLLVEDLNWEENLGVFKQKVLQNSSFSEEEKAEIWEALDIAQQAFDGILSKRDGDETCLTPHIPYLNHLVKVALWTLDSGLSFHCVSAALLHDVLEDTEVNSVDLKNRGISDRTIDIVEQLTKVPSQTRENYLNGLRDADFEVKHVKFFDRLHNVIRAFSTKDEAFIQRYITETKHYFDKDFIDGSISTLYYSYDLSQQLIQIISNVEQ
ncbi:MAG: hypothetical protein ACLFTJ_14170 [Halothece sp.]